MGIMKRLYTERHSGRPEPKPEGLASPRLAAYHRRKAAAESAAVAPDKPEPGPRGPAKQAAFSFGD